LKAGENTPELLDQLFWFVSAQFIRTHSFMSRVGRQIAWEERKKSQVTLDGREVSGNMMDVADTTSVMDRVQASWPTARDALETDYVWTVYHNHSERLFLTSDDPCQLDQRTQKVGMPLASRSPADWLGIAKRHIFGTPTHPQRLSEKSTKAS
jgi:hypothetical protein